jgi:hypothetical protein
MRYTEIKRIKVGDEDRVVFDPSSNEIIISRREIPLAPQEEDVTAECVTELRRSKSSAGYYVGILHEGVLIFALGVDGKSGLLPFGHGRYRIEPAAGATVSFRIKKV